MKYEKHTSDKHADLNLIICGRDENLKPGVKYGPVIRDSYIIECCTNGFGSVIINGLEFPIKKGDCVILFPGDVIIHTADNIKPRSGVWCGVYGMKIGSYLSSAGISSTSPYLPKQIFGVINEQIENMLGMKSDSDPGADLRREACIHIMFGELMRYAKKETDTDVYIQKAMQIMEIRYGENIGVNDIAGELGLERCYFSTLFKHSTGRTPYSYLTELRINKACTLLSDKRLSVSETAHAVGIEAMNFARVFKRYTGVLPTEYRKNHSK